VWADVTAVETNVMAGKAATSTISEERMCSSRSALRVSMEATEISALAVEANTSSVVSIRPVNSVKLPRTVVIRCRTLNVISECAGSICQIPAMSPGAMVVVSVMSLFPPKPCCRPQQSS
jgi:hypothetical protein